jgi:hypothetical protein
MAQLTKSFIFSLAIGNSYLTLFATQNFLKAFKALLIFFQEDSA